MNSKKIVIKEYDGNEPRDIISSLFKIGMWWRIFYGSLNILLGLYFLTVNNMNLSDLLKNIMGYELAEDPGDILYSITNSFTHDTSLKVTYFLAFYFLFWGILDVFLSINLLRERHWAYTTSLILISLFVVYEIFRVSHNHSIILAIVIVIDIFILYLIRREQKRHT